MFQFEQAVLAPIAFVGIALLTLSIQSQTELQAQIRPGSFPSTPGGVGRPGTPSFPRPTLPTPSYTPVAPTTTTQIAPTSYTPVAPTTTTQIAPPSYTPVAPTTTTQIAPPSYTPVAPSSTMPSSSGYSPSTPSSSMPSSSMPGSFQTPQMVYEYTCSKCGKKVTSNAKKCPFCGVRFTHTQFTDGSGITSASTSPFYSSSSRPSNASRGFAVGILIGGVLFVFLIIAAVIALIIFLVVKANKPKPRRSYGASPGYSNPQYRPGQNPNQFR